MNYETVEQNFKRFYELSGSLRNRSEPDLMLGTKVTEILNLMTSY